MSVQPSLARWWTRLLPTMPAPMTTTLAVAGTVAMLTPKTVFDQTDSRCVWRNAMRIVKLGSSITPARPGCQADVPGTGRPVPGTGCRWSSSERSERSVETTRGARFSSAQPGLDLVGVGVHPLLRGVVG